MKRKNFLLYLLFYLLSVIRMICSLDILYHFLIYFYIFLPFQSALTLIIIFPQSCFLSVLLCRWNNGINPIFASDTFDCFIHQFSYTFTESVRNFFKCLKHVILQKIMKSFYWVLVIRLIRNTTKNTLLIISTVYVFHIVSNDD